MPGHLPPRSLVTETFRNSSGSCDQTVRSTSFFGDFFSPSQASKNVPGVIWVNQEAEKTPAERWSNTNRETGGTHREVSCISAYTLCFSRLWAFLGLHLRMVPPGITEAAEHRSQARWASSIWHCTARRPSEVRGTTQGLQEVVFISSPFMVQLLKQVPEIRTDMLVTWLPGARAHATFPCGKEVFSGPNPSQ